MSTLFVGKNIIELDECKSVNTHAIELLKAVNLPEGTVIWTQKQTAGRGQRGNTWHSEDGKNLTLCFIFQPRFLTASNSFLLSMTISLALHDVLTEILPKTAVIKIKWPNDILVDGKKIAGILIENILREEQILNSVIGVGFNVNQINFGELNNKTNSLKLLTKNEHDLPNVMDLLCSKTEKKYLQLRTKDFASVKSQYLKFLYLLGYEHEFTLPTGLKFRGWITDVSLSGEVLIENNELGSRKFRTREISF